MARPLKNLARIPLFPAGQDAGLLLLRLLGVTPLLLKHGLEKLFTFSQMAAHFPDPLHIGAVPSLICAMLGDAIASILLLLGLFTRWAALVSLVNLLVAWAFVHHFLFFGHDSDHGELIVLYLAIMATLVVAGPGRYSLDAALFGEK
ncbi:DoxX family protein [Silvibacterium dinghuense]|uniref:DoxX family protein n=1 Tax=Silvibacterium dinghuense TaxID=1560006 RepID=A0A4Q1S9Y6_9BACT|nr:DoxX family protein [Silvibacterium dinghuense]